MQLKNFSLSASRHSMKHLQVTSVTFQNFRNLAYILQKLQQLDTTLYVIHNSVDIEIYCIFIINDMHCRILLYNKDWKIFH